MPTTCVCLPCEEGRHYVDLIAEWNVPSTVLQRLRGSLLPKLRDASSKQGEARNALRAIYQEHDSWDRYTTHYEERMWRFAWILGSIAIASLLAAIGCLMFPKLFILGLLFAGTAGGCVSVLSKMPTIEVEFSGALDSYRRRIVKPFVSGLDSFLS